MHGIKQSPWIIHYDASSCNGCDIETLACLTPIYDVERLGVVNTGNPKHADIFLVTGAVNEQSQAVIRNIYHQLPEPKVVVAVGICAASGGIFRECYNISGGVDSVIPVDVYVPGCAARPEAIIDGVVKAIAVLEEKHREMKAMANSLDQTLFHRADKSDAPEILALQKIAYQSEAELYGDDSLPALQQTLEDLEDDFERMPHRGGGRAGRSWRPGRQRRRTGPDRLPESGRQRQDHRLRARLCPGRHRLPQPDDRPSLLPPPGHRPAAAEGDRESFPAGETLRGQDRPPKQAQPVPIGPGRLPGLPDRAVHAQPSPGFTCKKSERPASAGTKGVK